VTDTLAPSYAHLSSISAGTAAERAASKKVDKYAQISISHDFVPIAIEILGTLNKSGTAFITAIGKKISAIRGDRREVNFCFNEFLFACRDITLLQFAILLWIATCRHQLFKLFYIF
jgi:hypothetical protein